MSTKIYLAGPIFTEAEIQWTSDLRKRIANEFSNRSISVEISWPYELIKNIINENPDQNGNEIVISVCKKELDSTNIMVAILDGTQVDDGTAWEIGYFFNRSSGPIFGIRTDSRSAGDLPNTIINSLIQGSINRIFIDKNSLIDEIVSFSF